MQLQPHDYLKNQNKWIILLIGFVWILAYCWIFSISFSMMKDVHSKYEYFNENLKIETEKLETFKRELNDLKQHALDQMRSSGRVCHQCWFSIYCLDYDYLTSHVVENNKHVQKNYNDTLSPLQYWLSLMCFLNIISLTITFKTPTRLFLLSNLFAVINFFIHGDVFSTDVTNINYTIIIGIFIFLYSLFVLVKILITLVTIVNFQIIKKILSNE